MNRHILVTGGAGYIGSHICKSLARAGYVPVTLDNLCNGNPWSVRWGPMVKADIADPFTLAEMIGQYRIESVVHCAAYAYVGESMRDPGKYFENNVARSIRMLETLIENGVRQLVFSSSCAVYGIPEELPIRENVPTRPVNPYGESKLFIEKALDWYARARGLRSVSLRYFNAAGADPGGEIGEWHDPETHLIPLAISAALGEREQFEIFGTDYPTPDGTAVRDYSHVSDLADAHVLAVQRLESGGANDIFNLGAGAGHSVQDIVAAIERVCRVRVQAKVGVRRSGDPAVLYASPERARSVLGWRPVHSDLETIIRSAFDWQLQCRDDKGLRYSRD